MKRLFYILLTVTFFITGNFKISAQAAYDISFIIDGLEDTVLYMGSYWGDKMMIDDTSSRHNDTFVFKGSGSLDQGIYFVVDQNKNKLFEFCIDENQSFILSTDTTKNFMGNMDVKGSRSNELFFDYQNYTADLFYKVQELYKVLENEEDKNKQDSIKQLISDINVKNVTYKNEFIIRHPDHILSLIFLILKEPEIPDSLNSQTPDSKKRAYNYYKKNYWQYVNFSDPRLLKTPVFSKKINRYFNQVISKHPDSAISAADYIMNSCKGNEKIYRYLLFDLTSTFEQSNIMGYDKAFVHMVDKYFKDDHSEWISPSMYDNITERVERIRPLLLGEFAPELILMDTLSKFKSLYEEKNDFTIVLFWTFSCGECKREIEQLQELKNSEKYKIGVFAVNTDTNLAKWKNYITKNNLNWTNVNGTRSITKDYHILYDVYKTPTVYLLDKKYRIIAKHLEADQIRNFIQNYDH